MGFIDFVLQLFDTFGVLAVLFFTDLSLWPVARYILPRIKSRTAAAIFHLVTGLAFCYVMFESQIIIAIIMTLVSYVTLHMSTTIAIIVAAILNSGIHIFLMIYSPEQWKFGITCLTMIAFHKILATAFNLKHYRDNKQGKKLREFQKQLALSKVPNILEWFAYIFTPYGGNSGPTIEFKLFDLILETGNREHIKDDSIDRKMARKRWIQAIIYGAFNAFFMPYAKLEAYTKPPYTELPILLKPLATLVLTIINISRYHCAWLNVDAGFFELGLGSTPFSTFEDVSNGTLLELFSSRSIGQWIQIWNHTAHLFWKRYLFYPLKDSGFSYAIAHNAVFAASAVWHGFQPVFYLVLPELLLATSADQILDKFFPITDETPFWKTLPRRFWIAASMLNSISTWWYRTADAFFLVKRASHWLLTIFIVVVFIFSKLLQFMYSPKKPKAKDVSNKTTNAD
jgi:hypothetical protein